MTEKVGFFGGSFDPIHLGHLMMAKELMHKKKLSEIWFCPARISPHKLDRKPASIDHRMKMVELAIEDEPRFKLLDIEAKREGPSYTVDTIQELVSREQLQDHPRQIHLILSDEALPGFFHWRDSESIVEMVPMLIGRRHLTASSSPKLKGNPVICRAIEKGWVSTDVLDISSTEIRQRLREGESCEEFVPKKVLDFIYENNLYC